MFVDLVPTEKTTWVLTHAEWTPSCHRAMIRPNSHDEATQAGSHKTHYSVGLRITHTSDCRSNVQKLFLVKKVSLWGGTQFERICGTDATSRDKSRGKTLGKLWESKYMDRRISLPMKSLLRKASELSPSMQLPIYVVSHAYLLSLDVFAYPSILCCWREAWGCALLIFRALVGLLWSALA